MKQDDEVVISPNAEVVVTKMNHLTEVQYMEKMNRSTNIKKLDKHRYTDLQTGEIKEFKHTENRQEGLNSLRQTFKKLRYLINNNFNGSKNELHVILTYKENMTDTERLYSDFKKFIMRLKYKYKETSAIDYISVIEPQERGAWHCHVLMRFNDLESVYIANNELREMWRNGFVQIKSLRDIDNIGAYLSAYLADVELNDETNNLAFEEHKGIKTAVVDGVEKKFIKGARLHLYPVGMNIYRKSKGIVFPERKHMKFKDIKKIVGSTKPHYQKSIDIETENFSNTIKYIQYNTKR